MKILLGFVGAAIVMLGVVTSTHAQTSVLCKQGANERVVEIVYAGQQGEPPCEVHYKKTTEQPGHDQVIYNAAHDKGYCEARHQEFVEQLRGMGWECGESAF